MNRGVNTKLGSDREVNTKNFCALSKQVVDAAYKVHHYFGSGLLESIYEDALCLELEKRNINIQRQKSISVYYEGQELPSKFRIDLLIENKIIVELKSLETITNAHKAQILSYLKISQMEVGFIMNFGDPFFKRGIQRFVMDSSRQLRVT